MNCPRTSCSAAPRRPTGSDDTVPSIRNVGARWVWVFGFGPRPFWPRDSRSVQGG
jgi:hypothetical protein